MKIIFSVIAVCLVSSLSYNIFLLTKLNKVELQLMQAEKSILTQNKALEQLKLDSDNYHCNLEELDKISRKKYAGVMVDIENDNMSCENKLQELEKILGIYENK